MKTLPNNYHPQCATDFVGPARACAEFLEQKLCPVLRATGQAWRGIFAGVPGIGKSELVQHLVRLMGCGKWSVTKYNGRQLKTEQVEDICRQFWLRDMFGGWRILIVEELDTIPPDARSRLLTAVDDMPDQWIFAGTTNKTRKQFRELHEATASRYEWFEVDPPTDTDVMGLMAERWPEVPEAIRMQVATFWPGNVRAALLELNSHYLNHAALPVAA